MAVALQVTALFGRKKAAPKKDLKKTTGRKAKGAAPTRRSGGKTYDGSLKKLNKFARDRSNDDARLLQEARSGKFKGKMTEEQQFALRRSINGTARGFFKDFVDVKGEYTDQGWVAADATSAPTGLPFLIAVVIGLLGATAYVVAAA